MTASGLSADDTIALHQLVHEYAHIVDDGDYDVLKDGYLGAQWRSPPADWPDHYAYLDKKPSRGTTTTHPKLEDI